MSKLCWTALLIGCLSMPVLAQTVSGSIVGRVADASSLPVAGATVTLRSQDTGRQLTQTTTASGDFNFAAVQPGTYTVSAEMKGFKRVEKENLNLTAAERLSAGTLVLQVGEVTESVTVDAAGTPVQVASGERTAVLTPTQMNTLMARGRDFLSLLRTVPGVVPSSDSDAIGTRTAYPNAQGMRISYPSITIDGVTNNDLGSSQTTPTPINMDAVGEVKVLMTNYQAEYGRTAGMLVQAVTKAGTNEFHGSAYYYKRNEEFNANNFFSNRNGSPIPRYRFNTWGWNLGGPVDIPHVIHQKDKLFFFFSQEYLPTSTPQGLRTSTMPTQAQRNGDFSALSTKILDPLNGNPFPDNKIPATRIDPNGQKLLDAFPMPNMLDTSISKGAYNYVFQEVIPATRWNEVYRVDYNINDKTRLYARGLNFRLSQSGYNIGGGGSGASWDELKTTNRFTDDGYVINLTHTFSPVTVNESSFGVHHSVQNIFPYDQASIDKVSKTALGMTLPQIYPQLNPLNLLPWASFGGITGAASFTWDQRFPTKSADTIFDYTNNLTHTHGAHILKAGIYYERTRYFGGLWGTNFGSYDFSSDANNPLDTRYAYSNALLGVFRSYQESNTRVETNGRGNTLDWFVQDTWKVTPRLTLDYGMRFSWYTPYTDKNNLAASFVPSLYDPAKAPRLYYPTLVNGQRVGIDRATGNTVPALLIGAFVPGTGDPANGMVQEGTPGFPRGLMDHQGVLFAPRFGFAYDPFGNGKTAIRGGFGIVYNARERVLLNDVARTPPIQYTPTIYYSQFSDLLGNAGNLTPSTTAGLALPGDVPTVYNFSFGIQREIGFKTVLDVAYVGALGRHLLDERNLNALQYGQRFLPASQDPTTGKPLSDIFLVPYQGYGPTIQLDEFGTNSSYHSMQLQLNRRFAHGLVFGASWTWSKSMDYVSNDFAFIANVAPRDVWNYGESDFDRTHVVSVNWTWDIPPATKLVKNSVVGAIFNNWQLSGIASFISGAPGGVSFSALNGVDIPGGGDGVRPILLSNAIIPKSQRSINEFFDPTVFAVPAVGTFGNAPRVVFRGPGINNFDMSIFKNIPIHERARLQFRFEAYNAFNHTQFSGVNTSAQFNTATGQMTNAALGTITSARGARVGQASLRFSF
ncbi:MAG TPA: TonB-dependent receptor [Bryobacteraceae bacterium]|nr:TonB-dependent receptor [Bryobacteraceae bacterium]